MWVIWLYGSRVACVDFKLSLTYTNNVPGMFLVLWVRNYNLLVIGSIYVKQETERVILEKYDAAQPHYTS